MKQAQLQEQVLLQDQALQSQLAQPQLMLHPQWPQQVQSQPLRTVWPLPPYLLLRPLWSLALEPLAT